ncbi:YodC family protein [Paenirhodobacter enshiensis]|uniref:YodC family protein n=1 Tax=Paenirhodobacter enshiensis TaxID=1105367 RepID=UPI0035B4F87A
MLKGQELRQCRLGLNSSGDLLKKKSEKKMEINVGCVVQLKSGGPLMTVAWIENGEAYCEWFDNKKKEGSTFQVTSLTRKS